MFARLADKLADFCSGRLDGFCRAGDRGADAEVAFGDLWGI